MNYLSKFNSIKKFVNLNIPHNKKNFNKSEKALITKYYNKLENLGYLNNELEGYVLTDISRKSYKLRNAPRLKKLLVNVGTDQDKQGNISTAKNVKITIRNGRIYTKRKNGATKWEFTYNIRRDWKKEEFKKHLIKQMGGKPKPGQFFEIGAGIYTVRGSINDSLDDLANEILKMAAKYSVIYQKENINKHVSDWLGRVIVYDALQSVKEYRRTKKRKKTSKRERIKGRK